MPPRGFRYLKGPENAKGRPGPRPFPGSRRKRCDLRVPPAKPIQRRVHRHTKKRKVEVLMWLAFHRVPEPRRTGNGIYTATRLKAGMCQLTPEEQQELNDLNNPYAILYRPPTYQEAEDFWKISCSTISRWWYNKEKYLTPDILEKIKGRPVELVGGIPSNPTVNSPSAGNGQPGNASGTTAAAANPQTVMEISDDSGSDSENDSSDDDEELPDLNTALGGGGNGGGSGSGSDGDGDRSANTLQDTTTSRGGTEDTQEFQDAQEFQQQQEQQQQQQQQQQQEAEDDAEDEDSAVRLLQAY
ncbi:hypothetical protein F4775DRAFT_563220 [Biscogniauxia sp. FL1348]|nr:hypothetical protein F4775DRAFT_563220 [Biscogniauxia sp. FL1348]